MTEDPQSSPRLPRPEALFGYFLFAVGWALAGRGCDPRQVLARVYLKAGFPLNGLRKALETPGERVLLRDVQREGEEREEGEGEGRYWTRFSMDACSFIFPLCTGSLDPNMV